MVKLNRFDGREGIPVEALQCTCLLLRCFSSQRSFSKQIPPSQTSLTHFQRCKQRSELEREFSLSYEASRSIKFVCSFIFGQLFDRKHRFEDNFVLFGENREDASGNVMQQPFDTPWCPPSPHQGLLEGTARAAGAVLWSQGMGSGLGAARPGIPPSNGPSPGVALSVGLNSPEAALRVGG